MFGIFQSLGMFQTLQNKPNSYPGNYHIYRLQLQSAFGGKECASLSIFVVSTFNIHITQSYKFSDKLALSLHLTGLYKYVDKTARKRDNSQYQFVLFSLNPY